MKEEPLYNLQSITPLSSLYIMYTIKNINLSKERHRKKIFLILPLDDLKKAKILKLSFSLFLKKLQDILFYKMPNNQRRPIIYALEFILFKSVPARRKF